MVRIEYAQEKPRKIIFIVPGIFIIMGIIMIIVGYREQGKTSMFIMESLLPALVLIAFIVICFIILVKRSIKRRDDVIRIKEKGYQVSGEILKVNTFTHTVRKSNGVYHDSHYYTFTVKYVDPYGGYEVVNDSIRTFEYYEPKSGDCILRVLGDEVLVESANVVQYKGNWSKIDFFLVCAFFIVIIGMILFIVIPILGTI